MMMAYEAVVSLNLIIESFLNIPKYRYFFLPIPETKIVHEEVLSLKSILEWDNFYEKKGSNALEGDIVMKIPKFRDVLEEHINKCQLLFSESQSLDKDLEKVRKEMISFVETMKKILKEYSNAKETSNVPPLADSVTQIDMVGVYDEDLKELIYKLLPGHTKWRGQDSGLKTILVVGMAGIGKTTIVKAVYNDPIISDYFDCRAFLRVGPYYHLKDILLDLLVCLFPNYNIILGIEKSEEDLKLDIRQFLNCTRYLIVLDDVWDRLVCYDIVRLLDNNNGSRIIFTTRLSSVAFGSYHDVHKIRFRNEEESWNLFCRKIVCPPGFEKVGKTIVKKCEGLPLGIISIASILSKAEKLDYWENVAKNENLFALATEEGSHMAESLFLSYKHLPLHLKECCLYFGVFPLNHEISVSKLFKLWDGEGLVESNAFSHSFNTFEDIAWNYLEDLISCNIILVCQRSSSGRVKRVSAKFFWNLLVREAANKKIFHLINSYSSAFSEGIHCQRRLCIHKNALLGLKSVSESIESVSNARSFLCTGPEHRYPVSICSGLKSIKVLDALTVRLYKFPIEILELVLLKYLAFTYDGKLHFSISRLKNLVHLIVHRYHLIIINSSPSYMPIEIWNMQELRHLQVMGSDLPHPIDGAQLPNLLMLLGVSGRSCTKEVLQSIPNLEKLGVRIVLPQDVSETLHIFDHLAQLSSLKSFKCIVSNPNPRSWQVLLLPKSVFPSSLTTLTLSGCGFAWEDMSMIGALPNLRVLKLRCYAFQGPEWVTYDEEEFPKLEYLLLEDTDLMHWKVGHDCFRELKHLIIRHCYKLRKIIAFSCCFMRLESLLIHHCYELDKNLKWLVVNLFWLVKIEFVDCSRDSIASAKKIQQFVEAYGMKGLKVEVYSSWE